jgi:flagellar motor switch protein FliM
MAEPDKILSQHEVDALLSAIDTGSGEAAKDVAVEPYDFRRPSRVPAEQVRFLQVLHEGFARTLQAALSGLLMRNVEARLTAVHQQPIREVLDTLSHPTVLFLVSAEPLEGHFLVALNPTIAYPLLERLMGAGKVAAPQKERPLSALEWNVADTLMGRLLEVLREAWSPVAPVHFKVIRRESDPGVIRFENPDEPSVSVSLEMTMGDYRGGLELAFPSMAIEPYLPKMVATTSFSGKRKEGAAGVEATISKRLGPADVELEVRLPLERISLGEVCRLRPGDLVVTNHPATAPLQVMVEGKPKFAGRLGRLKDQKAVRILQPTPVKEPSLVPGVRARVGVVPGETGDAASPEGFEENLQGVEVRAAVILAEKTVKLKEALGLRPGDLVGFSHAPETPLKLRVADRVVAEGAAVRRGERFALQVSALRGPRA